MKHDSSMQHSPQAKPDANAPAKDETLWSGVGDALSIAGRAVGAGAVAVGRSVAAAYQAVDPDLRRQAFQAPLVGLMTLAPSPQPAADEQDDRRRPIIFVHGLAGHPGNFAAMRRYVAYRHGPETHTIDLRDAADFDDMAAKLGALIDQLSQARSPTGPGQVDIVAHSMGGIAARLALDDPARRARVGTLITMATPHQGTHLARLAATPRTLDLRPGSSICERLDAQDFWSDDDAPRLIALWSRSDTTILPPDSANWPAAAAHHMDGFTHLSYLLSPVSWRDVFELLESR